MNAVSLTKPIVAFLFSVLLGGGGSGARTATVTYIPGTENHGVFNVVYNNEAGSRFALQILDADGNQLYQKIFTDKKFSKNFELADPDSYRELVFVIHNLDDHSSQRFEVEASTHLVEDVNVKEIK
jgi:hypothetical protein